MGKKALIIYKTLLGEDILKDIHLGPEIKSWGETTVPLWKCLKELNVGAGCDFSKQPNGIWCPDLSRVSKGIGHLTPLSSFKILP